MLLFWHDFFMILIIMLNQRGWYRGKTPVPWGRVFFIIFFSSKELTVMDDKEVKLLKAMEQNNKISARTLAMMLNISEKEVEEMIKELEEKNVILGYLTLIDWEKTSKNGTVTAIIDVQVTPARCGFRCYRRKDLPFPGSKKRYLDVGSLRPFGNH